MCDEDGSSNHTICDVKTGQCPCKTKLVGGSAVKLIEGLKCDYCKEGHWKFPECKGMLFQTLC